MLRDGDEVRRRASTGPELDVAFVHGWVYFVYLLFTANLAVKVRWPIAKTIGVLLAGTIPLVGIIVEQSRPREIKQKHDL